MLLRLLFAFVFILLATGNISGELAGNTLKARSQDGSIFEYKIEGIENFDTYRVYQLSYPSAVKTQLPQNNTIHGRLYLPELQINDGKKLPAVISLPILNGDENLNSLVCITLAKRGVASFMFTLPYYGERGTAEFKELMENNPRIFVEGLEQAISDIRRSVDLLQSWSEIDPQKIGITGISLGGILSATAGGLDSRFQRVGILLGGGDILTIIHSAKETRHLSQLLKQLPDEERKNLEKRLQDLDPLTRAKGLRARADAGKVLMMNATEDEVIPKDCTLKLAEALGITDKIVWFKGLGHYTSMAELPRALQLLADFFSTDLPADTSKALTAGSTQKNPLQRVLDFTQELVSIFVTTPKNGQCHFLKLKVSITNNNTVIEGDGQLAIGKYGRYSLKLSGLPEVGTFATGYDEIPWLYNGKILFVGNKPQLDYTNSIAYVDQRYAQRFTAFCGAVLAVTTVPELAQKWIKAEVTKETEAYSYIRVTPAEQMKVNGEVTLKYNKNMDFPELLAFDVSGIKGAIYIYGFGTNGFEFPGAFKPPACEVCKEVPQVDLNKMFAAILSFAGESLFNSTGIGPKKYNKIVVENREENGNGLLCRLGDKRILFLKGTPQQMGFSHGKLLNEETRRVLNRVLYGIGAVDTVRSGKWFIDLMEEINRRTTPYIPKRFIEECNAIADGAKIDRRDVVLANLFPERFHCTGVALRGKATLDGRVLHARVLDYMRDIGLQNYSTIIVYMPDNRNAWVTLSYAGFAGTVTAMNEKGLAIGEMGGRGEGAWDGMPMSFLLREIMERASTVQEALDIIRSSPRPCEYYYVISDKSGELRALHCLADKITVLKPGEQHPLLPTVPEDTVFVSGEDRAKVLSQRIIQNYGKIDAYKLMEIIKRPVAMKSNLHNAIFAPQTLDMWFSDAGRTTPACDEPYAHINLGELIKFYKQAISSSNN